MAEGGEREHGPDEGNRNRGKKYELRDAPQELSGRGETATEETLDRPRETGEQDEARDPAVRGALRSRGGAALQYELDPSILRLAGRCRVRRDRLRFAVSRCFDALGPDPITLEQTRVIASDGVAHLRYRVVRD